MSTIAIFGSYVLSRKEGAQEVLRDHWVLLEGRRIAAITPDRPSATEVFDRPGRFVLPGLLNLHNHCFSEAVARTHTEDGNGRKNNQSIVYTVLLPLTKRGAELLSPSERLAIARLGILQLLKGGATTVMEPFRNSIPEMFDAAEEMGIRFYGAPYLFSTSDVDTRLELDADALAAAVRRVGLYTDPRGALLLEVGDAEVRLRGADQQSGEAEESVKATVDGGRTGQAFQARYLTDALRPFLGGPVRLAVQPGMRATVLTAPDPKEVDLRYIVMPMLPPKGS